MNLAIVSSLIGIAVHQGRSATAGIDGPDEKVEARPAGREFSPETAAFHAAESR
jgi:hypothetical protein